MLQTFVQTISNGTAIPAIGIGFFILWFGFRLLFSLRNDNPLYPYAIQIFALVVILPIVLVLALTTGFPTEAVTGLLGTIVGFFFGGAGRNAVSPLIATSPIHQQSHEGVSSQSASH